MTHGCTFCELVAVQETHNEKGGSAHPKPGDKWTGFFLDRPKHDLKDQGDKFRLVCANTLLYGNLTPDRSKWFGEFFRKSGFLPAQISFKEEPGAENNS